MKLNEEFEWRGRLVRWGRAGSGPDVVMCHGTPWSSALWQPFADTLSRDHTVYLWDMPGYGTSSKDPEHRVALDVQGELLAALLKAWHLDRPHVVAHDYGGAVSLRAHLLHGARYASLALVDVVTLAPWGSPFFNLVGEHPDVFMSLPPYIHQAVVERYIDKASHHGLTPEALRMLTAPWLDADGQRAFYQQIAEADEAYTDEIEPHLGSIEIPVLVVWGTEDAWIPVEHAHRLVRSIPGAELVLIDDASHLIQLDAPVKLTAALCDWLTPR